MTKSPYVTEEPKTLQGIGEYMQKIYAKEECLMRVNLIFGKIHKCIDVKVSVTPGENPDEHSLREAAARAIEELLK